jgi:VanZ family protein
VLSRLLEPAACRALWILAMLGVIVGSLIPLDLPESMPLPGDKLQHLAAYALLALLAMLSYRPLRWALAAAVAMVALGIAIELVQYLLPWRLFEWLDILANTAGVALGMALGAAVRSLLRRKPAVY